ncbi:ribosome maturation factor RimP [Abyssicoccus albus]|uniref:Ribosome maturation factor RimP n=1 Tax=Abyssicoccus albus TaxID=1817405 RepID=A0A1Q1G1R7_9BACL|nr:ribosome maturation factor RimP [Abyssicoccus albus]AQL56301.1 ribosome maturation factor RimP [Abyssicoccus albus]RPF57872.1 ribosome maturation factor RimP [Abyssicoccus albus]
MSKIVEQVETMIEPHIKSLGFELVDLEYVKEGKDWFLRVFVDKPEKGIDLNDCTMIAESLSELLDQEDPIQEAYYLDVSSPGAERPLKKEKDFEDSVDDIIYVKLYEPIGGEKEYTGILTELSADFLTIQYKDKTRTKSIEIPRNKIAKARKAVIL